MIDDACSLHSSEDFDEFLWPLTNATWPVNWTRLAEEHRLRRRLQEILAHVHETHVAPRLSRLGHAASADAIAQITQSVIAGPIDGNLWERSLRDLVPRALRDEWQALCTELRGLCDPPSAARSTREKR
ncbi:MAG: hypothetical protein HYR72_16405 [Deltaproteobacteria bacterium]|nr:hypothetical protein [Deltaproteobacteria bacterium]MBI3389552.1 hypothetical protein [Deltaproteobacteria bacterium]